ncbi:hypothetical protein BGZ70_004550, partial [Mortierella alpina]
MATDDPSSAPTDDVVMASGEPSRELEDANKDKQKALGHYMDTKSIVRRLHAATDQDQSLSDIQRRKKAKELDAKVEDAKKNLDNAVRDFDAAHYHWMQLRQQPLESQYRDEEHSPSSDVQDHDEAAGSLVAQFNSASIWHCDIRRCLKEKVVPVFQNSEKIDFSRLLPKNFPDEPEFELNLQGKEELAALEIVRMINRFLREFRDFYKLHLGSLFAILASQYMMKAFRKAGIEVRLLEESLATMGKDLATQMEDVQEADGPVYFDTSIDTWFPIKCVRELFRVDLLKSDAVKQLFALDTSTFTDVHAYSGKVELLMEASGLKDSAYETLVLESLADSTQFPGRKTDWANWFMARFESLDSAGQGPSTSAIAAGKKPASVQQPNKGKHPRKEARQPCNKEKCTSGLHTPAQCYVMHPELRPQFKKNKSASHGHVRAVSAMKKAPAVSLQPVHAKRLAAMTQEIDVIRSSSLDSILADRIND